MSSYVESVFDALLFSYLIERDIEKVLSFLNENMIYCSQEFHEFTKNKDELRAMLENEISTLPKVLRYEYDHYYERDVDSVCKNMCANVKIFGIHQDESEYLLETQISGVLLLHDQNWKFLSIQYSALFSDNISGKLFSLSNNDRTSRLSQHIKMELLSVVSQIIPGAICAFYLEDRFPLYLVNDRMLHLLGCNSNDFIAMTKEVMLETVYFEDRNLVQKKIYDGINSSNQFHIQYRMTKLDGSVFWVDEFGRGIHIGNRKAVISVINDISDVKSKEQLLQKEASLDSLTGLLNRKAFRQSIIQNFKTNGILLILDIDDFKNVNDTYGHVAGDQVLLFLSSLLKKQKNMICCRLGGDEFMIYSNSNIEETEKAILQLQQEFRTHLFEKYPQLFVTVSAGGVLIQEGEEFHHAYQRADERLYAIKNSKKGVLNIEH